VEVVDDVLMQQVRLVEEEDGVKPLVAKLLDVRGDGEEDGGGGGRGLEAQREAQLPVEVAPAQGGVVAVGEAEALSETVPQSAQHARLPDAGLADEGHRRALLEGLHQFVDDGRLR
jgi:hypothetical protein